jgi:hypothetical protein
VACGWRIKKTYHVAPTGRLREHEAMHARINEAEAVTDSTGLETFRTEELPWRGGTGFERRVQQGRSPAVKKLHAEWDENHVFANAIPGESGEEREV